MKPLRESVQVYRDALLHTHPGVAHGLGLILETTDATWTAEDVKDIREEIERWRSINRELRQKLALAGVEGSPPGVPTLMDRLKRAEQERDSARVEAQTLREALRVIHTTVRGDEKSNCWTIRKWLDKRGVFNGDLSSSKRLIEAACLAALSPKEST